MLDRYEYINAELAENLICQSHNNKQSNADSPIDLCFNIKNYVVVHKKNILLASYNTPPTNEYYFDVMNGLMKLYENNVFVQPILGYTINEHTIKTTESGDVVGSGYAILAKQKGNSIYEYTKMPNLFELKKSPDVDKKIDYLLKSLKELTTISQEYYNKFVSDLKEIMKEGLNFDSYNQANILLSKEKGFVFTNINNKLSGFKNQEDFDKCFIRNCLSLCCTSFEFCESISASTKNELKSLNGIIFEKCAAALRVQSIIAQNRTLNLSLYLH